MCLYFIVLFWYGDEFDGKIVSLCVCCVVYWDFEFKVEDFVKKGICSNFLCDCKFGDKV